LWQDGQGGAGFIKVGTKHLFYMVSHVRALLLTPGLAEILLLALLGLLGLLGLLRTLAPIHLPHASALLQSNTGEYSEMDPLCVLDFYVQESCQRGGVGIGLFHAMQQVRSANSLLPFSAKLYALATHHFACVLDFYRMKEVWRQKTLLTTDPRPNCCHSCASTSALPTSSHNQIAT